MTKEEAWYCLCNVQEMDSFRMLRFVSCFSDVREIFTEDLSEMDTGEILAHDLFARMLDVIRRQGEFLYDRLKKEERGIRFVSIEHPDYPKRLRDMEDPPLGLFYRGELPRDGLKSAAIIGARTCSEYGREAAYSFGRYLAQSGVQVISGMALGADGAGQWGALSAEGKSYAVLGNGVDICYPQEHYPLYEKLCATGGVISEYSPQTPGLSYHFPRRNRIISALSDCVVVIEARKKSGTMTTVDHALNQGKDVFALPGRYNDPMSQGCNMLIKQGAYILTGPEDLAQILGLITEEDDKKSKILNLGLAKEENMVYCCISLQPKHMDDLLGEIGQLTVGELSLALMRLEIAGLIRQSGSGYYVRNE
ncbi:MAG: DNA-processing protein DprA [Lachnospiraceae bacterium]|nr:DNA-processing protein DprA [Lachnospiraceae bacterium]